MQRNSCPVAWAARFSCWSSGFYPSLYSQAQVSFCTLQLAVQVRSFEEAFGLPLGLAVPCCLYKGQPGKSISLHPVMYYLCSMWHKTAVAKCFIYFLFFFFVSLQKEQLEGELAEKRQIIDKLNEELSQFRTGVRNKSDEEKLYEELQANYELLETGNNKLRQDLYMTMKEKENLRLKLKKDYDQILASLKLDVEQSREQNLEKERFIHNQRVEVEGLVKDKDCLVAKLRESSDVTKEKLQSSEEDQTDGDDVVSKLKNEVNWLRKECQDCRMEKDKLYNKFHEVTESLRGELEKSLREKENLIQKSEETLNQNRDLQQSLIEKQSALTKAKIQFEHIGKGWRNDLDAARAERDVALRRLGERGTQVSRTRIVIEKCSEKSVFSVMECRQRSLKPEINESGERGNGILFTGYNCSTADSHDPNLLDRTIHECNRDVGRWSLLCVLS